MAEMLFDPEPDDPDDVEPVESAPADELVAALGQIGDLDDDAILEQAAQVQRLVNLAQARQLLLACAWADRNSELDPSQSAGLPGMERRVVLGGVGTPAVAEFAPAELAAQLGLSPVAGSFLVADALDLRHRLPRLWALVGAGQVRPTLARRVAEATRDLSEDAAARVDATVARYATRVGWGRLESITAAAVLAADPDAARARVEAVRDAQGVWVSRDQESGYKTLFARGAAADLDALDTRLDAVAAELADWGDTDSRDLRRAKALGVLANDPAVSLLDGEPADGSASATGAATTAQSGKAKKRPSAGKAILYLHLSEAGLCGRYGVARVEDLGPILADQVREFLAHRSVTVKPVVDLNRPTRAADAYEVPADIAEAVYLRSPADCFPHATSTSRRRGDLDHTEPYVSPDEGGPPGQTRVDNLGRLSRLQHRIKTHGRWKVRQIRSGLWLWTSPHRYHYLVDHTGTIVLGKL